MAALILPSQWTRQPYGAVELDANNPFGIVFASLPGQQRQAIPRSQAPAHTNSVFGVGEHGEWWKGSDGAGGINYGASHQPLSGNAAYSVITLAAPVAAAVRQHWYFHGSEAAAPFAQYSFAANSDRGGANSSGVFSLFEYDNAWLCQIQSTAGQIDGKWHVFAGVRNVATAKLYRDGVDVSGTAGTIGGSHTANHSVYVGAGGGGSARGVLDPVALVAVSNRALSAPEVAELSRNPWQIFRPQARRIYFDLAAGGSAVGVTSIPRWNALAYAPKSSTVRWNEVVTVGDSRGVRWNMLAAAGQSSLLRWDAIAVAAKSSAPRWNALTTAANTSTSRWNALAVANKASTPRWDSLTVANKFSAPRWDALVTANKSQAIRWDMLSSVILAGTDVTLRWNSIGIAQKLTTARWDSVIAVSKDAAPRWNAVTAASKSASTRWDLIAAVQQTVAPHWNLLATAGLSDALRWNMTQAVAQAVAARWNLVSTVAAAQTVTLRWHSISVSGKNVVCRWQVGDTGNTHYSYIDVLVLPEENRVMVLSAPNNVITIH